MADSMSVHQYEVPCASSEVTIMDLIEETVDISCSCRLCLAPVLPEDTNAVNMFVKREGASNVCSQLWSFFQIRFEDSPGWPSIVCGSCVSFIAQMKAFKGQIISSHRTLFNINRAEERVEKPSVIVQLEQEQPHDKKPKLTPVVNPPRESSMEETRWILKRTAEEESTLEELMISLDVLHCTDQSCLQIFPRLVDFEEHKQNVHPTEHFIQCCKTLWSSRATALDHMAFHLNPDAFKCPHCGMRFKTYRGLGIHEEKAHKKRPEYTCDVCQKSFRVKTSWQTHILIHRPKEEWPFKCDQCDESFTQRKELIDHVEEEHEVQNRHMCDQCGKCFSNRTSFVNHMKAKQKLKRKRMIQNQMVVCDACGVSLKRSALAAHKLDHEYTPQNCSVCNVLMRNRMSYISHTNIHKASLMAYKCDHCPEQFQSVTLRYNHFRMHHPEEFIKQCSSVVGPRK